MRLEPSITQPITVHNLREVRGGRPAWQPVYVDERLIITILHLRLYGELQGLHIGSFTGLQSRRIGHTHRFQAMKKPKRYPPPLEHLVKWGEYDVAHSS